MKRVMTVILAIMLILSMVACTNGNNENSGNKGSTSNQEQTGQTNEGTTGNSTSPSTSPAGSNTSSTGNNTSSADKKSSPAVETKKIRDARGEVAIPVNPTRIVDLSGASDILSILGYKVIATANIDVYDHTKLPSYLMDPLNGAKLLATKNTDVSTIQELKPDLIIISTMQEKMYNQFSAIAPTLVLRMDHLDWDDNIMDVARVMGKETEARAWLSDYELKAEEVGRQVKKLYGENTTYLAFLANGDKIFILEDTGIGDILYDDMDLEEPKKLPDQENTNLPEVTYDELAAINADYIFAIGTDADLALLSKNSVYKGIKAVKDGKVISLNASPYFSQGYSPIGRNIFLDEVIGLLESVKK